MRNLPDIHLAISVLISLGNSSGSGFIYRTDFNVYLVTAKHVLYDDDLKLRTEEIEIVCQSSDLRDSKVNRIRIELNKVKVSFHKLRDVAIVNFGKVETVTPKVTFRYFNGVTYLETCKTNIVSVTAKTISKLEEVMISNDIYVFGYPTSLGIEKSKQFDPLKPLLRKGIVANINSSAETIILDCPVYGGNSGGPVIQVINNETGRHLKLIGVVSQYIPYVQKWKNDRDKIVHLEYLNSGYSVATSFDSVLELIENESKATTNSG